MVHVLTLPFLLLIHGFCIRKFARSLKFVTLKLTPVARRSQTGSEW